MRVAHPGTSPGHPCRSTVQSLAGAREPRRGRADTQSIRIRHAVRRGSRRRRAPQPAVGVRVQGHRVGDVRVASGARRGIEEAAAEGRDGGWRDDATGQGARSCRARVRGGPICASPRGSGPVGLSAPILPRVRSSGEVRSVPVGGCPLATRAADGCLSANGFLRLTGVRGLPTDRGEGQEVVVLPRGPLGGQITDDVARSLPATCVAEDRESTRRRVPDRRHVGSRGGRAPPSPP